MRVRIRVADSSPRSFSAVRNAAGSISTPRFLISSRPMPRSRSAARQRARLGGQHLAHAEARHERARERGIRRQIGDLLGEHARLERAGDVADQARADHRAVGLVHERAERTGRLVRGIRRRGQLPRRRRRASRAPPGARRSRASAPDHSTSSIVDPSALTHCASTSSGIIARSRPGTELDAGRDALARGRTPSPAAASSPRAARARSRCGPTVRRAGSSHTASTRGCRSDRSRRESSACRDGHRVAERGEVVGGDRRRHLVGVDRLDPQAERGESQRIAADPAAEVGDRSSMPASRNRAGVLRGDRETRRLLEAGAGEQHPVGERRRTSRALARAGAPARRPPTPVRGSARPCAAATRCGRHRRWIRRGRDSSSSRRPSGVSSAVSSARSTRPAYAGDSPRLAE